MSHVFTFGTYNLYVGASDSEAYDDLFRLMSQCDALAIQEAIGKHDIITQINNDFGTKVMYDPDDGEVGLIWNPRALNLEFPAESLRLSPPTTIDSTSGSGTTNAPAKWMVHGRFTAPGQTRLLRLGSTHFISQPHVAQSREDLWKLEIRTLADTMRPWNTRPIIAGDWNEDYDSPWFNILRNDKLANNDETIAVLPTFTNASDGAKRTFDQFWFRRQTVNELYMLSQRPFKGASDHTGIIGVFSVNA